MGSPPYPAETDRSEVFHFSDQVSSPESLPPCDYRDFTCSDSLRCRHPAIVALNDRIPLSLCLDCRHRETSDVAETTRADSAEHQVSDRVDEKLLQTLHVTVTTYRRPAMLQTLLQDLVDQSMGFRLLIDVYDDASPDDLDAICELPNVTLHRRTENGGKQGFWHLIHTAFQRIRAIDADYYLSLQDDIRIPDGALHSAIASLDALVEFDEACDCLNLLLDESRIGKACWTGFKPKKRTIAKQEFWHSQWTDMLFVARRSFFEMLNFEIAPIHPRRWRNDPTRSSGVGEQISRRLVDAGRRIYQVTQTILTHGNHASRMHPTLRRAEPLIAARAESLIGGVATIPGRHQQLRVMVESIIDQLDHLHVYLNGFDSVPDYLSDPRITCYRSADHLGDVGDAGKFFAFVQQVGYYFSLDDDIQYPQDYVQRMRSGVDDYGKTCCVGLHGIVLPARIESFYTDRWVHHGKDGLAVDQPVHLLGTGLMAVYTGTLHLTMDDLPEPNMADIWLGLAAQRQQVGMVALSREPEWVEMLETNDNIYSRHSGDDERQTELVNGIDQWTMWSAAGNFRQQSRNNFATAVVPT